VLPRPNKFEVEESKPPMRRNLIKQDAFDRIISESVNTAERELVEAEAILSRALSKDGLSLRSFTESTVLYETRDNTYVHAGYEIKDNKVAFNNIEELVVDDASRKARQRESLSEMIDLVLTSDESNTNEARASELFKDYLSLVRWDEVKGGFPFKKKGKKDDADDDGESPFGKKKGGFPFGKKKDKKGGFPFGKKKDKKKGHDDEKKGFLFGKAKKAGKDVAEAYLTSQNVLDYCEYMRVGPALAETAVKTDDKGNVTALLIPSSRERAEAKLQRVDWRTLNSRVAEARRSVPALTENPKFAECVADLKRQNAFSDMAALEDSLDKLVKQFPQVLYATQPELAQVIGETLTAAGVSNWGDDTCEFMAEGVLKTAHRAYAEKVAQVLHLASAPKMDEKVNPFRFFQHVTEQFYPALDQKFGLERQVFEDLHGSLAAVYKKADRQGDNALKSEAASYLNDVTAVLNGALKPELELAEDAADWLGTVIETNLTMGKWVVSNTPHLTVNGDHPDMAKKAGHSYTPSKDLSTDWGDSAPAIGQDSMDYKSGKHAKTMRNDSWGQTGGKDVFPHVKNPYIPKPFGDYTMKGEKGVDKDNKDWSLWSSGDTWPNLENPYVPGEKVKTGGKGYKMKNGKETDLVVDM
jgi:hypothetical protein